jgi:hypothetical protein
LTSYKADEILAAAAAAASAAAAAAAVDVGRECTVDDEHYLIVIPIVASAMHSKIKICYMR